MKKNICIVTGSRSEYGLLKNVIKEVRNSNLLNPKIIVTGTHLSKKFGNTVKYIHEDGFKIDSKLKILKNSDTPNSTCLAISTAISKMSSYLNKNKTHIILILGDRFEVFACATAALINRIPIAHVHGGELTYGLIDDSLRHAITKMSQFHFVSNIAYKKRIVQLGENKKNIFLVGAPGIDSIKNTKFINTQKLQKILKIKFKKKIILMTYNPISLDKRTSNNEIDVILKSLAKFSDLTIIITMPNTDPFSFEIFKKIKKFESNNLNCKSFKSLGQNVYYSLLKVSDLVIGNSSSGIIETPYFFKPCVNIGRRQEGRIKAKNIIDSKAQESLITKSIKLGLANKFKKTLKTMKNPYGNGTASKKIANILEKLTSKKIEIKKKFFDLKL
ncbi:MAG: UDP-N-acetylglucosamine 2-epimerase (hydrolyzing) [Pelagibacterales bacterium]|nr:UDP-N-acetylglucosamine 2-epimerase (hydrolyzing) [Pelagibacterales bacterium]